MKEGQLISETSEGSVIMNRLNKSASHTRRTKKITNIQQAKQLYLALTTGSITSSIDSFSENYSESFRSSLLFDFFRAYEIQADQLPNTYPVKEGASQAELNAIASVKDTIHEDCYVEDAFLNLITNNFRTEGVAIVQLGYDHYGEVIDARNVQFANFYTDYDKDTLARDELDRNDLASHWGAVKVPMTKDQFNKYFPDYAGMVMPGDPIGMSVTNATNEGVNNAPEQDSDEQTIWVVYYYHDSDKQMVVYAGGDGMIVGVREGEKYPHKIKRRNQKKSIATLPFVDFHYTRTGGEGICTLSQVEVIADIAMVDRSILSTGMSIITKVANPILAVFGASDGTLKGSGRMREVFENAWKLQQLGKSEIVPLDEQAKIDSISPDASIISILDSAQMIVSKQMAVRTGYDPRLATEQEGKATVFVGQTKAQIKALNALYKANRPKFNIMEERFIGLAAFYWKDDDRPISFVLDDETGAEHTMKISELLPTIRAWDGRFETDVDIKMPLTTTEKQDAIGILTAEKSRIFYSLPWISVKEIMIDIDSLVNRARLAGFQDLFKKSRLISEAKEIEMRKQPQPLDTEANIQGEGQAGLPDDIKAELSPNSFISEQQ